MISHTDNQLPPLTQLSKAEEMIKLNNSGSNLTVPVTPEVIADQPLLYDVAPSFRNVFTNQLEAPRFEPPKKD